MRKSSFVRCRASSAREALGGALGVKKGWKIEWRSPWVFLGGSW